MVVGVFLGGKIRVVGTVINPALFVDGPGMKEQGLQQTGFSAASVANQGDIPDCIGTVVGHESLLWILAFWKMS
ncbi:hypothetical protein GCM10025772_22180 [Ferrimonas gelatinilytica]|uniref:Uncharacterized protein n=1 Tax=Ferrimonas gelatinilytica TaxID=1255257 RepID=A0ABP9S842_9GAMM